MEYKTACTNCGESNFHVESNISFITGVPGFHVCHNCGYYTRQFQKIARQEIMLIKERFSKHPKHFFKQKQENNSRLYYILLLLAIILFSLIYILRIY